MDSVARFLPRFFHFPSKHGIFFSYFSASTFAILYFYFLPRKDFFRGDLTHPILLNCQLCFSTELEFLKSLWGLRTKEE